MATVEGTNIAAQIVRSVADTYGTSAKNLAVDDITSEFLWIKNGKILWIKGPGNISSVVYIRDKKFTLMNKPDDSLTGRQSLISQCLIDQLGHLPGLNAQDLALAVRNLLLDPRGYLVDSKWFNGILGELDLWLFNKAQDEPKLRRAVFEPALIENAGGTWELRFNFMNHFGGIEEWRIAGNPAMVTSITSRMAQDNGTFRFPVV